MSLNGQGLINIKFLIMKKSILNLGKALNKVEQKQINGGAKCWINGFPCCGECNYSTGICSEPCEPL
ncbi:hypothetical protein TAESTU_10684 [Tenacibaculum aestuarii]